MPLINTGRPDADAQNGMALVAVLWLLLLLAVIVGAMLREVRSDRRLVSTAQVELEGKLQADAGINRAILSLLNPGNPVQWRLNRLPQRVRLFDRDIGIAVESESGKIDLNAAPRDLLAALFRSQGVASAEADLLGDRVAAWRAPGPSVGPDEASDPYRTAGLAYGPRHAPFRSVGELRLVFGMSAALQAAIAPLVTVYSRSASVDRQAAPDGVLRALEEQGDGLARSQREAREQGEAAGEDRHPARGEALTIRSIVEMNDLSEVRTAVIRLTDDARQPYWVLAWR